MYLLPVILLSLAGPASAQPNLSGAAKARQSLERLNVVGSVLMIAAHPDDENTALLAYLAKGRHLRTGYLSLTRGEGGQNLIGSEQGDLMGVIRTQELLAARRIDGGEQFFSRAIDFGFSKTADETLAKWGRDAVLGDAVWVIRKFRPDVVIFRFSGTPRDGHGHHQSSRILGQEAFTAAADPRRFPEQLKSVEPWQAQRAMYNYPSFTPQMEREADQWKEKVGVDTGEYDPVLGFSFTEIAGMSRSQHRSQAMGSGERKGAERNVLITVAGDAAKNDILEGIDITWNRVKGGAPLIALFDVAARNYDDKAPEKTIPVLIKARAILRDLADPRAAAKLAELDEAIANCAGLWFDASAERYAAVPGMPLKVTLTAINRSRASVMLDYAGVDELVPGRELAFNQPQRIPVTINVPASQPYTQPYWLKNAKQGTLYGVTDPAVLGLADTPPPYEARFVIAVNGERIEYRRPVHHRYVDRARGELTRPLTIVPPVALKLSEDALIFPSAAPKKIELQVRANLAGAAGTVGLSAGAGWTTTPGSQSFKLADIGEQTTVVFEVTPPAADSKSEVTAVATINGRDFSSGMDTVEYTHIPPQTTFPAAKASLIRVDAKLLSRKVGYVMGAGDEVPAALRQLGADVTLLSAEDLARRDLKEFDAIVTGVRAYNVRADLRANQQRLLDYVKAGGTMVVQYNVQEGGFFGGDPRLLDKIGPYPMKMSRDRVTVEEAPVKYAASHPVMSLPNKITDRDFDGWVQERGLYFASEWDPRYVSLLASNDPGEPEMPGGTLFAKFGAGAYIFTAYAWFRQLPAGVPGAYRLFANFLSAGKTTK